MRNIHHDAAKKAVNVTVNSEILALSKQYNINLSQTLETALIDRIREEEKQKWLAENQEAVENYNNRVEKQSVFSDKVRKF